MSVKTQIECGKSGEFALLRSPKEKHRPAGLVTYTEPLRDFEYASKFAFNESRGLNMAINVAFSGTPETIHDGTDSVAWTASALAGTWDFASTTVAQAGTKSVDATATVNNDTALFDRGSSTTASSWAGVSGYIYVTSWPTSGSVKDVKVQLDNGGTGVGVEASMQNYIDTTLINTWQKFNIPMDAFLYGGTMDGVRIRTADVGGGAAPDYYIDEFQLEETGGAAYSITPDTNTILHLERLVLLFQDNDYTGIVASGSTSNQFTLMPFHTDAILGLSSLTNPISVRKTSSSGSIQSVVSGGIADLGSLLFSPFVGRIQGGGDGTGSWLRIEYDFPPNALYLDDRNSETLEFDIFADLTALDSFTATAIGRCERLDSGDLD